jgi:hypothetical protein
LIPDFPKVFGRLAIPYQSFKELYKFDLSQFISVLFSRTGLQRYDKYFKSQEKFKIFFELSPHSVVFCSRTGCKGKKNFHTFNYIHVFFHFILDFMQNQPTPTAKALLNSRYQQRSITIT